jgi:hypothetical protein
MNRALLVFAMAGAAAVGAELAGERPDTASGPPSGREAAAGESLCFVLGSTLLWILCCRHGWECDFPAGKRANLQVLWHFHTSTLQDSRAGGGE